MDLKVLEKKLGKALQKGEPKRLELAVSSTDRAVGTILGSDITRLHGGACPTTPSPSSAPAAAASPSAPSSPGA